MKSKFLLGIQITLFFFLSGCTEVVEDLGNDYFLAYNSTDDFAIGKKIKGVPTYKRYDLSIYGHVLGYAVNDTFLLVVEKPRDSVPEAKLLPYYESQKLFNESNFRQFYIVNKISEKVNGPFNEEVFNNKRKELGVPDNLIIKKVDLN